MEAAKHLREEQLQRWESYIKGEPTDFVNHQNKSFKATYDPSVLTKARSERKVRFQKKALFLHAAFTKDLETLEALVAEGVNPNVTNAEGLTALHTSCIEGSLKVTSALVRLGADVNLKDDDWWTPLYAAAACGHWQIVNFLLTHDADLTAINADGDMPHDLAEGDRSLQALEDALQDRKLDDNEIQELKLKPEKDFMALVDELLAANKDLDQKDERGVALLHIAACNGWLAAVKALCQCGADVNVQDSEGNTATHLAVFFMQFKCVEALGAAGAGLTSSTRPCKRRLS